MNSKCVGNPSVSIVIPLYNKGKYIERALSSALEQTHSPSEIIVVDDGSTDDGPERVLGFNDARIVLVRQENKGPGPARNTGLGIVRSKYVTFLDADDRWMPSFLQAALSFLEEETAKITVVCTGHISYPDMKPNTIGMEGCSSVYEIGADSDIKLVHRLIDFIWTSAVVMRTEAARKRSGFYENCRCLRGEDKYLWFKLLFNERIGIIHEPLVYYHKEASDLVGCDATAPPPLPAYTLDPAGILASCPAEKRRLLRMILAQSYLEVAKCQALWGQKRVARKLIQTFRNSDFPSLTEMILVRLLIIPAPIWPPIRSIVHSIRFVVSSSA